MLFFSTSHVISWLITYKYIMLFPIALVEGPIISMICGLLASQGYVNIFIVYAIVVLGDLVGDVVWYYIGFVHGHKFIAKHGERFGLTEEKVSKIKEMYHKHNHWILLFSKLTNGFGFAIVVLFTAGVSKISFRRFMIINFCGQLVWSGMLLSIGYFFGDTYQTITSIAGKISFIMIILIILALFVIAIKKIRNKIA